MTSRVATHLVRVYSLPCTLQPGFLNVFGVDESFVSTRLNWIDPVECPTLERTMPLWKSPDFLVKVIP